MDRLNRQESDQAGNQRRQADQARAEETCEEGDWDEKEEAISES